MRILLNWIVSAVALWLVAQVVPGFHVSGLASAMIGVAVIGLVNATLGVVLKIVTFPLSVVTLGIFWWVINALMLWVASAFVPGFTIHGFGSALVGAVVLALVNMVFHRLLSKRAAD
jgi:putative membrane protein